MRQVYTFLTILLGFAAMPATAHAQSWSNKQGILPTSVDAFYKDGPMEITVSADPAAPNSGRALISFTEWGDALSCQYGDNAVLISDKGESAPLESMGCAPEGPKGATFMSQLSNKNVQVFKGASRISVRQDGRSASISINGLDSALQLMK
ncbi:hypothetical protein [Acetobacter pasteurianus]|uniref:hypothetical protein n=1 Tax=Acetobacter pasteurianus TaxID=438 RepID=UPI00248FF6B0|nr:hypothetical protein [Acetobacter pasteurianus]